MRTFQSYQISVSKTKNELNEGLKVGLSQTTPIAEFSHLSVCLSVFYLIEQVKFWQLLADADLLYFHRGQPQHRELHALLFSNNVWVI